MRSIDEESSPLSRLYEAKCPKVGAPLTEPIELKLGEREREGEEGRGGEGRERESEQGREREGKM